MPRLSTIPNGCAFRFLWGDDPSPTLPVFVKVEDRGRSRILNLASGAVFDVVDMEEEVKIVGPVECRGPIWDGRNRGHK